MKNLLTVISVFVLSIVNGQYDIEVYKLKNDSVKHFVYSSFDEMLVNSRSCITDWSTGEGECKDKFGTYNISRQGESFIEVYKSGVTRREINIEDKVKKGKTLVYHPTTGAKFAEFYYDSGKLWNVKYFDSKGAIVNNGGFLNGEGILKIYRFSGSVSQEIEYAKGQPNGSSTYYYSTGRIMASGSHKFGRPNGYWREYNTTGKEVQLTKMSMGLLIKTESK